MKYVHSRFCDHNLILSASCIFLFWMSVFWAYFLFFFSIKPQCHLLNILILASASKKLCWITTEQTHHHWWSCRWDLETKETWIIVQNVEEHDAEIDSDDPFNPFEMQGRDSLWWSMHSSKQRGRCMLCCFYLYMCNHMLFVLLLFLIVACWCYCFGGLVYRSQQHDFISSK